MSFVRTPSRRNLAILMALTMIVGTFAIVALPAQANHPPDSCLDLEPETDTNPTGTTHTVTATLRTTGGTAVAPACPDVNPNQNTASNTKAATSPVVVNFEITGPNDPGPPNNPGNDGDTPGTPDRTCTIPTGQTSCGMPEYRGLRNGTDTIRGWIQDHPMDADEPRDASSEQRPSPLGDEPDTTDVVTKTWQSSTADARATRLDCEPETDTNPTGDPHTVTCTATNQYGGFAQGTNVDAEATGANDPDNGDTPNNPDFTCETDANGQCRFTHGQGGTPAGTGTTRQEGTTSYRAWIDSDGNHAANPKTHGTFEGDPAEARADEDNDNTDVVEKTWVAAPLNCTPETDVNPSGTTHTITCSAQNTDGTPRQGAHIDMEASGANDPDGGNSPASPDWYCTTDANGQCTFTHGPGGNARTGTSTCPAPCNNTNATGTTTYRAWIDEDGDHAASPPSHGSFEGDAFEGQDETTEPGSIPEQDRTDVVTKTWGASRLDCNPETDRNPTGTSHNVICEARDNNNNRAANTEIDVEAAGANDPDGSESFETPDFSCVTQSNGQCTIVHGPGGIGTTNDSGTTVYTAWIDLDRTNSTPEADRDEGRIEGTDITEPDNTDVVEKTWIAGRLDCEPEADTNPARTAHTVTCRSTDASGFGVAGTQVDVEATGPNDPDNANSPTSPDFTCTTGADGSCSFTHGPGGIGTTEQFGRTLYRAWIDADGNNATAEADPTEGRDENAGGPQASPTPGSTASPRPTGSPTASGQSASGRQDSSRVIAQQQTSSPTPTPTNGGGTASPSPSDGGGTSSPSPTPTQGGGSPTPSPTPTGTPAPSGPGRTSEPDDTDVVEKNWSAVPSRLTIAPETDAAAVGSCNAFTVTALDASGAPVPNVVIDVEQRHERSDNTTANDEPHVSFCRPDETEGPNPSDVDETRGDLGDGRDGATGGEADRATDANGKVTFGVRVMPQQGSSGTGRVLVTVFYENEDNDDPDTNDPQASATKTWTAARGRAIDCDPDAASNRVGTEHTVTCTVRDANGQPAQGEGVTFTEDGPGDFTTPTQRTTNSQGQVTATTTSNDAGTQRITGTLSAANEGEPDADECERAAGDPQGAPAGRCSDTVEKTWTRGNRVGGGACKGFFQGTRTARSGGGEVIVGTPGADTLRGTDGDDVICGLGGKDTLIGRGGDDLLAGGRGNDILRGNAGGDTLRGAIGEDTLAGGAGKDRVYAAGGDDILRGGGGADLLKGGGGKDVLRGRWQRDRLFGGKGNDALNGGPGRDFQDGGPGNDVCRSGGGNDRFRRCE
ncbi:MAG TPA: Ig-like domain-containing protein [Actinomycetota bacterium]|nr:Ig-like domain-containing protein [Actinomycetota bacterium]